MARPPVATEVTRRFGSLLENGLRLLTSAATTAAFWFVFLRKARLIGRMPRRCFIGLALVCLAASSPCAEAAQGRVIKVLPHFLDLEGHHALSPDMYQRDAYQAYLRQHPEKRSGIRFDVQWKAKGPATGPLLLRAELRGTAQGDLPKRVVLEQPVEIKGHFSHWTGLALTHEEYEQFGEMTAWRVTLWENGQLLGEQRSFLW